MRDGRIVRVGSNADVMRLKGPQTEVLDLQGATLVPGLQDAHGHVLGLGASLTTLDLRDTPTSTRIAELVAERAKTVPAGQWILGSGWDQNDWPEKAWPTREILDRAAPNHPVLLGRIDGHASWANSRAMQAAGIDATTPDPSGGRLIRDATNIPTGILVDTAQRLVKRHVTEPSAAEVEARILAADRAMSSVGLTMVHDAGASSRDDCASIGDSPPSGRLNTRLYVMIDSSPATTTEWFARGPLLDRDHRVTVRAVKLYADGALGSRGAALLEPYDDEPGNRGLLVTPPERLATIAREAAARGLSAGDPRDRRCAPTGVCSTSTRRVETRGAWRSRAETANRARADPRRARHPALRVAWRDRLDAADALHVGHAVGAGAPWRGAGGRRRLRLAEAAALGRDGSPPARTSRSSVPIRCSASMPRSRGKPCMENRPGAGRRRAAESRRGAGRVHGGRRVRGTCGAGSRLDSSRQAGRFRRALPRYHEGASGRHPADDGCANHCRRPYGVLGACSLIVEMTRLPVVATLLLLLVSARPAPTVAADGAPALVVVLVVDQMRRDYIEDYGGPWTGGLRRSAG